MFRGTEMDTLKEMALGYLTSKKFVAMVVGQIILFMNYLTHVIPSGLEGLALEKAELAGVESYMNRAVGLLVAWVLSQGLADFGKTAKKE